MKKECDIIVYVGGCSYLYPTVQWYSSITDSLGLIMMSWGPGGGGGGVKMRHIQIHPAKELFTKHGYISIRK